MAIPKGEGVSAQTPIYLIQYSSKITHHALLQVKDLMQEMPWWQLHLIKSS